MNSSPYILSSLLDLSITGHESMGEDLKLLQGYVQEFGVYTLTDEDMKVCRVQAQSKHTSTPPLVLSPRSVSPTVSKVHDNPTNERIIESPTEYTINVIPKRRRVAIAQEHTSLTTGDVHTSEEENEDEDYLSNSDYDSSSESSTTDNGSDSEFEGDEFEDDVEGDREHLIEAIRKHRLKLLTRRVFFSYNS